MHYQSNLIVENSFTADRYAISPCRLQCAMINNYEQAVQASSAWPTHDMHCSSWKDICCGFQP
eukprot:scaffold580062_cov18-Prasinocladus_malaysianus.AAC.1